MLYGITMVKPTVNKKKSIDKCRSKRMPDEKDKALLSMKQMEGD